MIRCVCSMPTVAVRRLQHEQQVTATHSRISIADCAQLSTEGPHSNTPLAGILSPPPPLPNPTQYRPLPESGLTEF